MSELSYNDRLEGTTLAPASSGPPPSDATRPLGDRESTVDPASTGRASNPLKGSVGSDVDAVADQDRRNGRPLSVDGAGPGPEATTGDLGSTSTALVSNSESFRARWSSVQVGFVDDPRRAVEEAEQLVTDVIADLVDGFGQRRRELERNGSGSTDEMRMAFQGYRDFFDRLLHL